MTQIATTKEQAARLIACGVDLKSADMTLSHYDNHVNLLMATPNHCCCFNEKDTPAWSLSALLAQMPTEVKVDNGCFDEISSYRLFIYPYMQGWQIDYQYCEDDECHCLKCIHDTEFIEVCVKAIEWLTANGYTLNTK